MVDKRNADFHDLKKRLRFDNGLSYDAEGNSGFANPPLSIYESDILVWLVSKLTQDGWVGHLLISLLFYRAVRGFSNY